jgi:hypothetical protein
MAGYMDLWAMVSNKWKNRFWPGALKQIEEPILNCRFLQETLRFFYFLFQNPGTRGYNNLPNNWKWPRVKYHFYSGALFDDMLLWWICLPSCNLSDPRSEN